MHRFIVVCSSVFFAVIAFFVMASPALAVDRYWVGTTNGANTNDTANWATSQGACGVGGGASVPTSADDIIFTSSCTNGATVNANLQTSGVEMRSGYTGTITQASGITIAVGSGGWDQVSGTFQGSDAAITLNSTGGFTISGGTFTSTTGILSLAQNFTDSGGTFNHNNGTVTFNTSLTTILSCGDTAFNSVNISKTGNSFTIGSTCILPIAGTNPSITFGTGGDTLTINGTLNITGNPSFSGSTVTLNSGGVVSVSGSSMTFSRNLILNGGTFPQAITTLTVGGNLDNTGNLLPNGLDLIINTNNNSTLTCGTVTFDSVTISKTGNGVIVGSSCTLPIAGTNPTISMGGGSINGLVNNGTITITGNPTFNVGFFTQNSGGSLITSGTSAVFTESLNLIGGTFPQNLTALSVGGSLDNTGNLLPNGLALTINGSPNATFNCGTATFGSVAISKSGNGLTVNSNCSFPIAGTNPTITLGANSVDTLNNNGTITVTGNLTFNGGTFSQNTGGTLVVSGTSATFSRNLTLSGGTFPQAITTLTVGGSLTNTANLLPNNLTLTLNNSHTGNLSCGTAVFNSITFSKSGILTPTSNCNMGDLTNSGAASIANPASLYTFTITGNVNISSTANFGGNNLTLLLSGTNTQTISQTGIILNSPFQINKSSGTAQLSTDFISNMSCSIIVGTLSTNGKVFYCAGGSTLSNGAILQMTGGEFFYLPTFNTGSTVKLTGDGDSSSDTFILPNWNFSNLEISMTDSSDAISVIDTLANNLIGHWKMDEGSGTSVDDASTNNNVGTITGAVFSSTVPTTVFSNPYSLSFDGSGDYVNLGDNSSLVQNKSQVATSAWIRLNTVSGTQDIVGYSVGNSTSVDRISMQINGDELRCHGRAGDAEVTNSVTTTNANLTTGVWYHVACNIDFANDVIIPYIYGVEFSTNGTVGFAATATSNTASMRSAIGIDQDKAGNDFNGNIDEVRVYDRLLTEAEMGFIVSGYNSTAISNLTIGNNYSQTSGTFNSPATMSVAGNWTRNGGTFTHNNGSVVLNGGNQTIAGNTSFYNLTKAVSSPQTLTFTAGAAQTIGGTTTFTGTSGNLLSLRSSVEDSQWSFDPQGSRSISYVDVQDSNNVNASGITTIGNNITDSGNNTNWGFDSSAPAISLTPISPDPGTDTTPSISGTANEAVGTVTDVEFQMDSTAGSWTNCTADDGSFDEATEPFTCQVVSTLTDGVHVINVRATDSNGFTTADGLVTTDSFRVDTTPPSTPGTPSTTTPTADNTPTWSWTASTDSGGSGLTTPAYTVEWSQSSDFSGGVSSSTATTNSFTHSSGLSSGTWYIRVQATDVATNDSSYSANGSVIIDTQNPTSPGTPSTTTPTASTTQNWSWSAGTDAISGIAEYAWRVVTNLGAAVSNGTTATLNLTTNLTEGIYTFFVKSVDNVGNESAELSGNLTVDTSGPTTPGTPTSTSNTDDPTPTWTWTESSDTGVGLASNDTYTVEWSQSSSFNSGVSTDTVDDATCNAGSCEFTHTTDLTNGTWYVRIKATDNLGNDSSYSANGSIELLLTPDDSTAPTGEISIQTGPNNSESYTRTNTVLIAISATDETDSSDNLEMMIAATSDFSGSNWESYTTSKSITLSNNDGTKTIYIKFKDSSGNTSTIYSDNIVLDSTPPETPTLETPKNDTFTNNTTPTFKFKKSSDSTSGLSKYTLQLGDETFIGDIHPTKPDKSNVREDDIKKITYDGDYISVYKKISLKDGIYSWKVVATDLAGNTRESTAHTLTMDTTAPVMQLNKIHSTGVVVNPASQENTLIVVYSNRPTFSGTAEAGSVINLTNSAGTISCTTITASNSSWECIPNNTISLGNHTLKITATDSAGNVTQLPTINLVVWSGILETEIIDTKVITQTETGTEKSGVKQGNDVTEALDDTVTDLATSKKTYDVIVKIVDKNGKPLPFTKVTLFSTPRETITDKDGNAHFTDVEEGEHTIVVANNNQVGQQKITVGGENVERFEYTIQVKETNPFLNPWVAMTIGMLVAISVVSIGLLIRVKSKKLY